MEKTMDRRSFVRLGIVSGAASFIAPALARAGSATSLLSSNLAGGVFYTKEAPGRWGKKVGGHLPRIKKEVDTAGKVKISVATAHPMSGYKHYIVKHMLLDKDFRFVAEKMFDPAKDKTPVSTFNLDKYSGPLYALSVCNKHDTWISVIEV